MDLTTALGIVIAAASVLGGQVLEGGHVSSIIQATAFIIVIGGTIGAICVQNPLAVVLRGIRLLSFALFEPKINAKQTIMQLVELSNVARKAGLLALEGKLKELRDPFLNKGVQMIVDGTEPKVIRDILEAEVEHHEEENLAAAKIWESAGGYAPTVGILGAVLGLIHVMENLADPSKLGSGIATAFVATVYGVGSANLLFLPIGNKLKYRIKQQTMLRAMMIEGLIGLAQGENPRLLQEKLECRLPEGERHGQGKK